MKIIPKVLFAAVLTTAATGCESFLDVNTNPNTATSVLPSAQLASALVTTAAIYHGGVNSGQNYNSYSSFVAGYWGKSGVVSGFAEERRYSYTTNYYQGLFGASYDNLNDYDIIEKQGAAQSFPNHAAIARIMKVYNYLLLVDQYGDIPYSNALKGIANTSPSYDKAADIYKDFLVQLKGAVADINKAATITNVETVGPEDVVFRGNMTNWKRFANSLRLRILLRESEAVDVKAEMTALQAEPDGFITADVVVQPGYAANSNQQNPFYNRYGFAVGSRNATSEYSFVMPTNYIIQQYENNKDPRITQLYRLGKRTINGVATPSYVGTDLGETSPPTFVAANPTVGSRFLQGGTFLRAATAPTVLMLLAEHLFSKSEAETQGLFTGGDVAAKTDFLNGIRASFVHTYRPAADLPTATITTVTPGITQYNTYIADNVANPLVNYDLAPTGTRGKQSVIIFQKYLAENTVASTEAWADYRRTAEPKFKVSLESNSPRADKLPTRLFYPQTEVSTNAANVPAGVDQYTKIFWDVLD